MSENKQILLGKLTEIIQTSDEIASEYRDAVAESFQKLVNELKDEKCRNSLTEEDITTLCGLLRRFTPVATEDIIRSDVIHCTESVRCLRNACVQNGQNQNLIVQSGAVSNIKDVILNMTCATGDYDETDRTLVRCAIQLASNLVSGNPWTRTVVWKDLFPQSFMFVLRDYNDMKASTYCCMLLNECLLDDVHLQQLIKHPRGLKIIEAVLRLCEQESQYDFSLQIMQRLLSSSDFILSTYESLPTTAKITVLDILAAMLSQSEGPSNSATSDSVSQQDGDDMSSGVPLFSIAYLAEQFEEMAEGVMKLITEEQSRLSTEQKTPDLTLRILSVLGKASSNHKEYKPLQDRESLLLTALEFLEKAHLSGKRSSASPLKATQHLSHGAAEMSPVYGLKRDLVRLIGNMCYHHKHNQDKIREHQGIPLILEHCSVDDQNPFICQWAIFAIHNLCEGNPENQAYIANMTKQGAAPPSQFLRDAGVEVEMRGGMPYIKTKKK